MPRPRHCRRIAQTPRASAFKPQGVPMRLLQEVYLPLEGLEALRLADLEGLSMQEAAERMHVSRHTFGRTLAEARRAVAEALVQGHALRIEGGDYTLDHQAAGAHALRGQVMVPASVPADCPRRRPAPAIPAAPGPQNKENDMALDPNRVAVTSEGPTLNDRVDPRFGRAGGFVVVDTRTMEHSYVDNGASQAMAHGAGIQAAERIAGAGAGVLLTGYVGPKAFQALAAAGVKIGQDLSDMTVAEAVERFKAGQVSFADGPNK